MAKRFLNIQVLRAVAANAILLTHISTIEDKYGTGVHILPDMVLFGTSGVDLFFMLSGFIIATVARDLPWRLFVIDRVTRIYPPYWFYTTLILPLFFLYPAAMNASYSVAPSLWRSYLLLPDVTHPLLTVGWTLIHEMYFYAAFACILAAGFRLERAMIVWAGLVVIGYTAFGGYVDENIYPEILLLLHPLTLEFIAGVLIGSLIRSGYVKYGRTALAAGVAWSAALIAITPDLHKLCFNFDITHVALVGPAMMLIVYGSAARDVGAVSRMPAWAIRIGDGSYSIYLCHILVISAIGRIFVRLPTPDWIAPGILETGLVVACVVAPNIVGMISHRMLEKPVLRFTRHLFQKRPGRTIRIGAESVSARSSDNARVARG